MAHFGAISPNGGTCYGQLGFPGTTYPQIYGNGSALHICYTNSSSKGVVINPTDFRTAGNGDLTLGNGSHKWSTIYSTSGTINTSDKNEKNTIIDIEPEQAEKLVMGLKPVTYKFNDGTSGRTHWGMISQDIEELLPKIGMTDMDFAGFIKSPKTDDVGNEIPGEYFYALRYAEFIAPLIAMAQKQQRQIEDLERRLSALENKEEAK